MDFFLSKMCIGKTKRFIQYQIDRLQISLFSQSGSDHLTNPPVSESGFLLRENQNPNPDLVAEVIHHSDLDQQHFFFSVSKGQIIWIRPICNSTVDFCYRILGDTQFLYIDLVITTTVAVLMGRTEAWTVLVKKRPPGKVKT